MRFVFNTRVTRLSWQPVGLTVQGDTSLHAFDAIVLCAGTASASLLPALGIQMPLAAVHGYSVSAPLREALHAPQTSVVDVAQQFTITRLGQRLRIAGGAELGSPSAEHHHPTLQRLYRTLNHWFPGGAQLSSSPQIWRGARTMLPDGAPVLGASGLPGLWLNTGHGAGGWALACGSARAVSDLIAQRTPDIPVQALGLRNF